MDDLLMRALDYAITKGDGEALDVLIKDYDNFSKEDKQLLLMHVCANEFDVDYLEDYFNSHKIDFNFKDEDNDTVLHWAACSSSTEVVKFFLGKGLDVNAADNDGDTPVCSCARTCGNVEVLKLLEKAGADLSVVNKKGENLVLIAASNNVNTDILKYLLKKGIDPECRNIDGYNAVLKATVSQGNPEVLTELVLADADVSARSNKGECAFHLAAMNPSLRVVEYIGNSFLTSELNDAGETCFDYALKYCSNPDVMDYYLNKQKTEQLMKACSNDNTEVVELLVRAGFNPDAADCNGTTSLMMAAKVSTNPAVVVKLHHLGAHDDVRDNKGRNILHYAAANPCTEVYEWMTDVPQLEELKSQTDEDGNPPEYYLTRKEEF